MSHSYHPDSHTHGLADGCPRCEEHAEHPFESLDDENLRELVLRVQNDEDARSENEARAMRQVEIALRHAERLRDVTSWKTTP